MQTYRESLLSEQEIRMFSQPSVFRPLQRQRQQGISQVNKIDKTIGFVMTPLPARRGASCLGNNGLVILGGGWGCFDFSLQHVAGASAPSTSQPHLIEDFIVLAPRGLR